LIAGTAIVIAGKVDGVVSVTVAPVLNGPRLDPALWKIATDPIGTAATMAQAPAVRHIRLTRLGIAIASFWWDAQPPRPPTNRIPDICEQHASAW
jgi:hypothetical protein